MDRWALKLQQYNIKFQHVAGKENVVVDAISCLKTANLYEELKDQEVSKPLETVDDAMENLILEIHLHSSPSINIPFHLDSLVAQQKSDRFYKNKVKCLHHQQKLDFELDNKGVLRKLVQLCHTWESTIVIPKSLINNIIYEYHECRGHQGITRTVNMVCRYFWWPGMRQSIYQHIRICKLCVQFLPNKISTRPMHLKTPQVPFAGCAVDTIRLLPMTSKGNKYALTFICLLTSYLIVVPFKSKNC